MNQSLERARTTSVGDPAGPALRVLAETVLPTRFGALRCLIFSAANDPTREHVAMLTGEVAGHDVLLRIQNECLASDVFGSLGCRCRQQLDRALERLCAERRGLLIYQRRALTEGAEVADCSVTVALLRALSIDSVRLLADDASAGCALEARGVTVRACLPLASRKGVSEVGVTPSACQSS